MFVICAFILVNFDIINVFPFELFIKMLYPSSFFILGIDHF